MEIMDWIKFLKKLKRSIYFAGELLNDLPLNELRKRMESKGYSLKKLKQAFELSFKE